MSIGRLLAAGKSWAGGQGGRYRVNKNVQLPKFVSPKNPFTSAAQVSSVAEPVHETSAEPMPESKPEPTVPLEQLAKSSPRKIVFPTAKVVDAAARVPAAVGARAVRMAKWVGGWGQKLNPLPLIKRNRGPVKSAADTFKQPAVQTELSLDAVKPVRNDLSDADLEVVLVTRSVAPDTKEQVVMASVGGATMSADAEVSARGPLNRVTEWVFGPKS